MANKRRRDEDSSVADLVVRPAAVCSAVLDVAGKWRDKCNSLYDIDSKMIVGKDAIVLKVGFFEELTCCQLLSLCDLELPGNFGVQSVACDLGKQLVTYTIARGSAKRAKEAPMAWRHEPSDSETLRLRTVFDVSEADAGAVHVAMRAVTAGFDSPGDWHLARCAPRPAHYVMHVAVSGGCVPDGVLRRAADYKGVVDFDNKQIIFTVDKKQSEII
jgi:hypothetical protein